MFKSLVLSFVISMEVGFVLMFPPNNFSSHAPALQKETSAQETSLLTWRKATKRVVACGEDVRRDSLDPRKHRNNVSTCKPEATAASVFGVKSL